MLIFRFASTWYSNEALVLSTEIEAALIADFIASVADVVIASATLPEGFLYAYTAFAAGMMVATDGGPVRFARIFVNAFNTWVIATVHCITASAHCLAVIADVEIAVTAPGVGHENALPAVAALL